MSTPPNIAIIRPSGAWAHWPSAHRRGRPACHVMLRDAPERTLCGRRLESDWTEEYAEVERWFVAEPTARQFCKICAARYLRLIEGEVTA